MKGRETERVSSTHSKRKWRQGDRRVEKTVWKKGPSREGDVGKFSFHVMTKEGNGQKPKFMPSLHHHLLSLSPYLYGEEEEKEERSCELTVTHFLTSHTEFLFNLLLKYASPFPHFLSPLSQWCNALLPTHVISGTVIFKWQQQTVYPHPYCFPRYFELNLNQTLASHIYNPPACKA